jgi:lipopolysaccharide export system permease protein
VAEGVTITVGGRGRNGEITAFFADDRRDPQTQRTYTADTALLASDGENYVLQLEDGAMQFRTADGQFSEISFARYDIDLARLTGAFDETRSQRETTSWTLVEEGLATGDLPAATIRRLVERSVEGLRVLALTAVVAAMAAFPTGRRRRGRIPIELVVFAIAFAERGITSLTPGGGVFAPANGSIAMLAAALIVLVVRLRLFAPVLRRRAT